MCASRKYQLSFELFPPRTPEAIAKLPIVWRELNQFSPHYFSVTFGAGGYASQHKTSTVVTRLLEDDVVTAPHISAISATRDQIQEIIGTYQAQGIKHLVVVRGDLPLDTSGHTGDFRYANELVYFIRKLTGDHFQIAVAAYPEFHPQSACALSDIKNFQRKVEAGADYGITQYFFNSDAYYHYLEQCYRHGIRVPIVPGIMPVADYTKLVRFSKICQTEIPAWFVKRIEAYGNDRTSIQAFCTDVVIKLCEDLLRYDAPGFHFYTLNQIEPTKAILMNL